MKRVIKFRAIDNNNEWCYGLPNYDLDGDIEMSKQDGYTSYGDIEETLGQFTGLKDQNGVEIYEGDIVKSDFYEPEFTELSVIGYDEFEMKFCFNNKSGDLNGEQDAFAYGNLEVIGNIHQNPELLK